MKTISLEGQKRQSAGKKAAKLVRKENRVPCVIYGGAENISFSVKYNDLLKIVYTDAFLKVNVKVDNIDVEALVKDIDFHPVTDKILHVDFQELVPGKIIKTEIPVRTEGRAVGVATGGVLELNMRKLIVKCTPEQLVPFVTLDVTELQLGKSIKVKDVITDLNILSPGGNPIARVIVPRAMRSGGGEVEGEGEAGADAADATPAA
ncbi:MAG: large subunit ribosomal protein L25 [Planctomycetota bacterium]|jgi:large subunit ribosomal protein L25